MHFHRKIAPAVLTGGFRCSCPSISLMSSTRFPVLHAEILSAKARDFAIFYTPNGS
jgi:hypothetical protein